MLLDAAGLLHEQLAGRVRLRQVGRHQVLVHLERREVVPVNAVPKIRR